MFRIGYLTTLCAVGELDAAVDDLVKDLSAMAPLSVTGMKRAINEIARNELDRLRPSPNVRGSVFRARTSRKVFALFTKSGRRASPDDNLRRRCATLGTGAQVAASSRGARVRMLGPILCRGVTPSPAK